MKTLTPSASLLAAVALAACTPEAGTTSPATAPPMPPAAAAPAQTAAPAPPGAEWALTPDGWGPLRVGMTLAEVTAALGPDANPDAVGGADPGACDEFRPERAPEGMLLMMEKGVLTRISLIRNATQKSNAGVAIGDTAAAAKAANPGAVVEPHKYAEAPAEYITAWASGAGSEAYVQNPAARGVRYEIGGEGKVTAIRAGGPSIQYVEGCS